MTISGIYNAASLIDRFREPVQNAKDRVIELHEEYTPSLPEIGQIASAASDSDVRGLTAEERAIAKEYYGDSIDLDRVRVNESSALSASSVLDPNNEGGARPFVLGNTINYPDGYDLSSPRGRGTFIHELAHVWQFQNVSGFGVQVEGAELVRDDASYRIDGNELKNESDKVAYFHDELNIEQQAEVVQGYYLLQTHNELTARKDFLEKSPSTVQVASELSEVNKHLKEIENKNAYQDLKALTPLELQPIITDIKDHRPREGVEAEIHEAADEIFDSHFSGLEVIEGTVEVGREAGKVALEEAGNAIIDGAEKVDSVADDFKRVVTGGWMPFR